MRCDKGARNHYARCMSKHSNVKVRCVDLLVGRSIAICIFCYASRYIHKLYELMPSFVGSIAAMNCHNSQGMLVQDCTVATM